MRLHGEADDASDMLRHGDHLRVRGPILDAGTDRLGRSA
jgi:hypothetical protein